MSIGLQKRILFLDAYFEPEKTAYTHLENDLIDGLIKNGYEITVICPQPTRGVDDNTYKNYSKIEFLYDEALVIKRFKCPREGKNNLLRAFRYWLTFKKSYRLAKRDYNFDAIFCNSTPPIQGLLAKKVKKYFCKKRGKLIPFIYNLQDVFPDSLVNLGLTKKGSIIWKIGKIIERKTYNNADAIITISNRFRDNLIEKKVAQEKLTVVPNWTDTNKVRFIPRCDNHLFDKYGINRSLFYFFYCGNIGYSQNFDLLLDSAKEIYYENTNIGFIIVGDGAASNHLKKRVTEENIRNVIIIPFQDYKDISSVFSLGDVGLIISKKGVGHNSVPSKTWSYLAADRPILCSFDEDSELSNLVKKVKCGLVSEADDKESFKEAVKEFCSNTDLIKMGKNGHRYVSETLNKNKCVDEYVKVFNTLLES